MATWTKVSSSTPSAERSVLITAVEAGDQIDLVAILGRPARRLAFYTTDAADIVVYRLNNLRRVRADGLAEDYYTDAHRALGRTGDVVEIWSGATSQYSSAGAAFQTSEGVMISSVQIDTLTLSTGTTIELVAW